MSTHALLIGIAIWAAFIGACVLYNVRRKRRLRENPPSSSPQEAWDSLSPEAQQDALRHRPFPWNGGGSYGSG